MEINLKEKLRTLRQKKNITQETLANHLAITPQSVGKWERGEGFPDITLLPKIALYFDVTVDELLGINQARIEEKIAQYNAEAHQYARCGNIEAEIKTYEKAFAEFPNNHSVMHDLMNALYNKPVYPPSQEDVDRIVELGTRILEESNNNFFREGAVQVLCYIYDSIGDTKNAMKYAQMGGSIYVTQDELMAKVTKGEEGLVLCQQYIKNMVHNTAMIATSSIEKVAMSPEERIAAHRFAINLYMLLFSDGNVGFYAGELSWNYMQIAAILAETQTVEGVLESLKKAAEYAVVTADNSPKPYTSPLVNRLKYNPNQTVKNYRGNACNLRLKECEWKCFDFIRDMNMFQTIISDLEKHAE